MVDWIVAGGVRKTSHSDCKNRRGYKFTNGDQGRSTKSKELIGGAMVSNADQRIPERSLAIRFSLKVISNPSSIISTNKDLPRILSLS
jgi:hypothetical protein